MIQDAMSKADTLVEAMGWISMFRDKTTVIKLGGSVLDHPDSLHHLLLDICFMSVVGMRPVIVHGGGKRINQAMEEAGLQPRFIQGRRYTDAPTLDIVRRVLAEETNQYLATQLEKLGGRAMTLNFLSTPVLTGRKLNLDDDGQPLDLGFVGEVTAVERRVIDNLCYAGQIPVIPSMCVDESDPDRILNVNADSAAMAVAEALNAEKLVFVSDIPGVLRDVNDPTSRIPSLTPAKVKKLVAEGVISGGMIPKVEACLSVLQRGVSKVHIVDGRLRHSLLIEIYTTDGVGTQFVRDI
jgi:acetylglutamate kinase